MIKKLLGVSSAVLVAVLVAGQAVAATVIVDFESLATNEISAPIPSGYAEDGFVFTTDDPRFFADAFSVWGTSDNKIDTTALFSTYEPASVMFERADHSPFALLRMEMGPAYLHSPGSNLTFRGVKSNGDVVTHDFSFPDQTSSDQTVFTVLDFGADPQNGSFDDLRSVSFFNDFPSYQFDNIEAEVAAVPEPSTALLALAGLAMLGLWRTQIGRKALQRMRSA